MKNFIISVLAFWVISLSTAFSQVLSFDQGIMLNNDINTLPIRDMINGDASYVEITYKFTGASISEANEANEKFQFLHINGFAPMQQVGAPSLPAHNDIIAMPTGANAKIVLLETQYYEYPGFNIYPALEPATDTEGDPEPEFYKDEKIYTTDAFFPAHIVEVTDVLLSRNTPLALTQIRPVQFNPVTGMIRVYTVIKYRIEFVGGAKSFSDIAEKNSLHYTNMLKRSILNSSSIPDGVNIANHTASLKEDGDMNYIIITHSEYINAANNLANWKRQMGYSVEVVSKNAWTAAQVKDSIHARYARWNIKPDYFVIIGDHTGNFAVPGEIHNSPNNNDFATDLYYACMNGANDYVPDMAHGRISVSSAAEAGVVVNKIINYESNPVNNNTFYDNGVICAQYQDNDNNGFADRRFCHTAEEIRDYLDVDQEYTCSRIYYTNSNANVADLRYNNGNYSNGQLLPAALRNNNFDWDGGSQDIVNAINAGKFLVFHRDHGYQGGSGWAHPGFTTNNMDDLNNNNLLPVVFSINCHTGEFQVANCFAEKFLRIENKGAVGVVAAAYYSYSGYNDAFSIGMVDAIWSDPGLFPNFGNGGTGNNNTIGAGNDIYTMGDVVNRGLVTIVQNWNGTAASNRYENELFHWFGDPAMKIWTDNPNDHLIAATHSDDIEQNNNNFNITNSEAGAKATLVCNNKLIGSVILDNNGNGDIEYDDIENGQNTVKLTISKHNCYPYTADLNVIGGGGGAEIPSVTTVDATNVEATSATCNGTITDNNGADITESGIVYSTTANPVIGGAGVTKIITDPLVADGDFSVNINNLSVTTTYHFKAFGTNAEGTGYGDEKSFTTSNIIITAFPFTEGFEDGFGDFTQDGDDDFDWTNRSGSTPSTATGPSAASEGTKYIYTESSSPNYPTKTAILYSPNFDLSLLNNAKISFDYHMYGAAMGTLEIAIKENGGNWETIFTKSGDQGNQWNSKIIDLSAYDETAKLRFKGKTANSYTSDISIDNIVIGNGPVADFTANETTIDKGESIDFTDQSTGTPTSWKWNFGGGGTPNTSEEQNPTITFNTAGTYTVKLIAINSVSSDTIIKNDYITVNGAANCTETPYSQSFENTLGDWVQDAGDDIDWTLKTGSTPSSNTGPSSAADGTYYIYIESSYGNHPDKVANLTSPCLDLSGLTTPLMKFQYHMYGATMGTLNVQISTNNGASWTTLWTKSGNQANSWHQATVSLEDYADNVNILIRLNGTTGNDWTSDICIDDFKIESGALSCATLAAPADNADNVAVTTNLDWDATIGATGYKLYFGTDNPPTNIENGTDLGNTTLYNPADDLNNNTTYYWKVVPYNANGDANGCEVWSFTTAEENCNYCQISYSNTSDDYISKVVFNTISKTSGSTTYSDFTAISTDIEKGQTYSLSVNVTVSDNWIQHALAWFDWNNNCDFTDAGEVYDLGATPKAAGTHTLTVDVAVPNDANIGQTRLRIAEHYANNPTSCQNGIYGEAEDYTVNIIDGGKSTEIIPETAGSLKIYPNPINGDILNIESNEEINEVYVYSIEGVLFKIVTANKQTKLKMNVEDLESGVYLLKIITSGTIQIQRLIVR